MEPTVEPTQPGGDSGFDGIRSVGPIRFCLLSVGRESLAVDLRHVREVFRVEAITPVPGMPSALVGVVNLRGTIIPLSDLRPFLGVPRASTPKYAAVLRKEGAQIGILIDEVPEIHALEPDDTLEPAHNETPDNPSFLSGCIKMEGRISSLVDLSKLLALVEGMVDWQGHEFRIDSKGADSDERAVIPGEHRTMSDEEDAGHGEA